MTASQHSSRCVTEAWREDVDPLSFLDRPGSVAWVQGSRVLVAWGEAAAIRPGGGDGRFARSATRLGRFFARLDIEDRVRCWGSGPVAFGAFSFDPDSASSLLRVPSVVVGRDDHRAWITTIGAGDGRLDLRHRPPGAPGPRRVRHAGASLSGESWMGAVTTARAAVRDGILDKVVLARDLELVSDVAFDTRDIVGVLAASYPQCFTFAFDGMVGATPELLVSRRGPSVESVVLGGSAPRGDDALEDRRLGRGLAGSRKERREHELAVDSVRISLQGVCTDVVADDRPQLLRLPYVQHLRTSVRARSGALTALDLAGALHPTAAVCGTPADKALAAIRDLEGLDRGRYCGPVGWVNADGDGDWGIALRCAEVRGARARLFAGAGIVADSDPRAELRETKLKLRPLLGALEAEPEA